MRSRLTALLFNRMSPDNNASEIVRTILTLARELNLEVVAEGVETLAQLEALQALKCEMGQGFWIARPVDAAHTEEIIRKYIAGEAV